MEPDTNHVNPHIHLNKQHVEYFASIGLNGEFIYGQERLNRKEKVMILEWVNSHSITLRELWDCAKAGLPDYQRLVNKVNNSWEFPVFRNGTPIAENRKDGSCRQYALFFLGRNEDAMNWMNRVIDFQPNDSGNYYDKACLCSRMGLLNEAIEAVDLISKKDIESLLTSTQMMI